MNKAAALNRMGIELLCSRDYTGAATALRRSLEEVVSQQNAILGSWSTLTRRIVQNFSNKDSTRITAECLFVSFAYCFILQNMVNAAGEKELDTCPDGRDHVLAIVSYNLGLANHFNSLALLPSSL